MRKLIRLLNEKGLELFLGGLLGFLLGLVPTVLGNRLDMVFIFVVALILVLIVALLIVERKKGGKEATLGEILAFRIPRRGVIFTLGLNSANKNSVVYLVNKSLKPELMGFLGTPQTKTVVDELARELNLQDEQFKSESWQTTEIREGAIKTSLAIDWMLSQGLKAEEIVLDITGGTATMSIAAFIAAQEKNIDCQYIQARYDDVTNTFIEASKKPILITSYWNIETAKESKEQGT